MTIILDEFDAFNQLSDKKRTSLTPFQANIRIIDLLAMLRISEEDQNDMDAFVCVF